MDQEGVSDAPAPSPAPDCPEDVPGDLEEAPGDQGDSDDSINDLLEESSSSDSGREAERDPPYPGEPRGRKRRLTVTSPNLVPRCLRGLLWGCPSSCPLAWHHDTAKAQAVAEDQDEPLEVDHEPEESPKRARREFSPSSATDNEADPFVSLEESQDDDLGDAPGLGSDAPDSDPPSH